jgi:hypothetical protein
VTTITDLDDFKALDPFSHIIEKGLDGIADGEHFFDLLADAVIFEYIITTLPATQGALRVARPSPSSTVPLASLFASLVPADTPDQTSDAPAAGGADDVVPSRRPLAVGGVWRRDRLAR